MAYTPITLEGLVSTVNSSVVNLAANAVFTGVAEDITLFASVKVNVYSSHASATDGLNYQQSHDGILWLPMDAYTIPALSQKSFATSANMKFFRVVYTNGATATTQLVIQVLYHKSDKQPSSVKPQDGRGNDNDFVEMLSFLMGYNGTTWDRLKSSVANGLAVDVTRLPSSSLAVTTTAAAGVGATLTLPAVAGQFQYITSLKIVLYSAAARTGAAAPIVVTTTNIPGALAFTFDTAGAIGTNVIQEAVVSMPLKSSVLNTGTTIVAPAVVGGIWRITATYFTGA